MIPVNPLNYFFTFILCLSLLGCSKDSNDPVNVTITVTASDFSASINENPINGDVIGLVSASTNQGSVTFSILDQSPNGAFTINSNSGELTVANALLFDFEVNPIISGNVIVANGNVSETSEISISLIDVDENNYYIGDVVLRAQSEVDDFGVNNYTHITGRLLISSLNGSDINSLATLISLTSISESLDIDNTNLESLDGLNNLTHIAGNGGLGINFNSSLRNLDALGNLSLTKGIGITENNELTTIEGLGNVVGVMKFLTIDSNPILHNLAGLEGITSVNNTLAVSRNDLITGLNSLQNIDSIGENVFIWNNQSLENLNGLTSINQVGGNLDIFSNSSLSDLCGLQTLLVNGGLIGSYQINSNAFNPSQQDIIDGNCSL